MGPGAPTVFAAFNGHFVEEDLTILGHGRDLLKRTRQADDHWIEIVDVISHDLECVALRIY